MSHASVPILDAAYALHSRGVNVIPITPLGKSPIGQWSRWMNRPQSWPDVVRLLEKHSSDVNLAAIGGIRSMAVGDGWGYLAVVDCDDHDALEKVRALVKTVTGQDALSSASQRGGHVWLRTPWPLKTARWERGEVRASHAYTLAPPSVHPSGVPYRWINPDAEIAYCDHPIPGIPWEYTKEHRIPRLAAAIMRGDERVLRRYASKSEIDFALILSLVNSGMTFKEVTACYIASKHPKHLDPQHRSFERRLMAEYLRAKEQGHRDDYAHAQDLANKVKAWVLSIAFPGATSRTKETDRRIMLAHCERALKSGKSEWHLSRRDIESMAMVSAMTACKATRRLIKAGFIKKGRGNAGEYAQSYSWGPKVDHLHTLAADVCKWSTSDHAMHPAFEHRGLGRYAGRVFQVLSTINEGNTRQIAEAAGCSIHTARRHLRRMLRLQLVGYDGHRWWACPEQLDAVARFLHTERIPTLRALRIARERCAYRARIKKRNARDEGTMHSKSDEDN